jgi:hypothetical protein
MAELPPAPLPYADPRLAAGSTGYRATSYPADYAGYGNGRVFDDGTILRLEPSPVFSWRTLWWWLAILVWGALVFLLCTGSRQHPLSFRGRAILAVVAVAVAAILTLLPMVSDRRTGGMLPWIVINRKAKRIQLPRERRELPYEHVVRLQLVSFGKVGLSKSMLNYSGVPPSGELQIVFNDAGSEQTWCVVDQPDADPVNVFALAFHEATGVPVSRVYPTVSGEWHVEPFDGTRQSGRDSAGE